MVLLGAGRETGGSWGTLLPEVTQYPVAPFCHCSETSCSQGVRVRTEGTTGTAQGLFPVPIHRLCHPCHPLLPGGSLVISNTLEEKVNSSAPLPSSISLELQGKQPIPGITSAQLVTRKVLMLRST